MESDGTPRNYSVYFFVLRKCPLSHGGRSERTGSDHTDCFLCLPPAPGSTKVLQWGQ